MPRFRRYIGDDRLVLDTILPENDLNDHSEIELKLRIGGLEHLWQEHRLLESYKVLFKIILLS